MKTLAFGSAGFLTVVLFLALFPLSGCQNNSAPADPTTVAALIQAGTDTAVALGMMAVPNDVEANQACTEALGVLDDNILPLLKGDEAALANGLQKILALEAFNNPKLSKVKLILDMALPLLQKHVPSNLVDNQLTKIDPNVKLYITAFFQGARQGLADYLGKGQKGSVYQDLKHRLAAN